MIMDLYVVAGVAAVAAAMGWGGFSLFRDERRLRSGRKRSMLAGEE